MSRRPAESAPQPSRTSVRTIAAGFLGNMTSVGLTMYLFGIVLDDMRESLGASVTTVSFATSLWLVVTALVSPCLGPALSRLPICRAMLVGAALISSGIVLLVGGAALLAVRAVAAILGKIGLGTLSDSWGRKRVLALIFSVQLVVWLLLVESPNATVLVVAGVANAFFAGAVLPVESSLYAATFGPDGFAKATGFRVAASLPLQLAAPLVAGAVYDAVGDDAAAFRGFLPAFAIACVLLWFVEGPRPRRPDRPLVRAGYQVALMVTPTACETRSVP